MSDDDFARLERFADVDATDEAPMFQAFLDRVEQLAAVSARRQRSYVLAQVAPGDQVIDVGCGLGTAATEMAVIVGDEGTVLGVDASDAMVTAATQRHAASRATFEQGDALDLAVGDATVDVYRAERLYQHLDDPAAAMGEAARVLRPGGRLVLIDQDWDALLFDGADRGLTRSVLRSFSDSIVEGWIGRRFHALLIDAGFAGVEVEAETVVSTDWEEYGMVAGLVARTAAADPNVGPDASEAWLRDQEARAKAGRWVMTMTHFLASGRVGT
jgi:ubiquinone/menaquinone biosynthesis C-methylase UbiE